MSIREYIGARYIPLFSDPIEWDSSLSYEPLTVVKHQGGSYVSRQFVPEGVDISNTQFWILWADFNAQLEQYRQEVRQFDGRITANADAIADETEARAAADSTLSGDIAAEKLARETADTALSDDISAEANARQAADTDIQNRIGSIIGGALPKLAYDIYAETPITIINAMEGVCEDETYIYIADIDVQTEQTSNRNQRIHKLNKSTGISTAYTFSGLEIGHANGMCARNGKLYIATWHYGIAVVDAASMQYERTISTEDYASAICTTDNGFIVLRAKEGDFQSAFDTYDFSFEKISSVDIYMPNNAYTNNSITSQGICYDGYYFYILQSKNNALFMFDKEGRFAAASTVFPESTFYNTVEFEDCYTAGNNVIIWAYSHAFKQPFAIITNITAYQPTHRADLSYLTGSEPVIKTNPNNFNSANLGLFAYPEQTSFYANNNPVNLTAVNTFNWKMNCERKLIYQAQSIELSNITINALFADIEIASGASFKTDNAVELRDSFARFSGPVEIVSGSSYSGFINNTLMFMNSASVTGSNLLTRNNRIYVGTGTAPWVSTAASDANYDLKNRNWF